MKLPRPEKQDELSVREEQRLMKGERMKKAISKKSKASRNAELAALAAMPEHEIDTSDIPEIHDWSGARRGVFYRPRKQQLTLRLDADVIAWFKEMASKDEGYQTKINRALREYWHQHEKRAQR